MKKAFITIFTLLTTMVIISINCNSVSAASQQRQLVLTKSQYTFNVREDHSSKSTAKGKVSSKDFPILILDEAKDENGIIWYKIKENSWIISSKVLKLEEVSTSESTTSTTKNTSTKASTTTTTRANSNQKKVSKAKYIQANGVTNVRQKHELGRNVIAKWHQSDTPLGLKVLEEKIVGKMLWYKVSFNGKYGWCQSVAVTVITPTSTTIKSTTSTTATSKTSTQKTTTTSTTSKTSKAKVATTTTKKSSNTTKTSQKTTSNSASKYGKKAFSSSYSTNYGSSDDGRKKNIQVTCNYLNGITINPGKEFNWFTMMPTTTEAHGYKLAGVIQNGKIVQGMGGGLCQVTSTLYNVCLDLEANEYVKITARKPHGLAVSYVPPGRDATICRGSNINYKFKNTSDCILVISAKANGKTCTVCIDGYEKNAK